LFLVAAGGEKRGRRNRGHNHATREGREVLLLHKKKKEKREGQGYAQAALLIEGGPNGKKGERVKIDNFYHWKKEGKRKGGGSLPFPLLLYVGLKGKKGKRTLARSFSTPYTPTGEEKKKKRGEEYQSRLCPWTWGHLSQKKKEGKRGKKTSTGHRIGNARVKGRKEKRGAWSFFEK